MYYSLINNSPMNDIGLVRLGIFQVPMLKVTSYCQHFADKTLANLQPTFNIINIPV